MAKKPKLDGALGEAFGISGPNDKEETDEISREAARRLARLRRAEDAAEAIARLEARERGAEVGAAEEAEAEAEAQIYEVQAGDTLSKIAGKLLGDPKRWKEIFQANQDQIENPDLIQIGWKLRCCVQCMPQWQRGDERHPRKE